MRSVMAYIAGLLFGLGLAISGMTDPARVLGFLDVAGDWDPTLMFVLGGAVVTNFFGYRLQIFIPGYFKCFRCFDCGYKGLTVFSIYYYIAWKK